MKWSFKIGRVFDIELRVHITFFLIIVYAAYIWGVGYHQGWAGAVYGAVLISALFLCVVIHELCHSRMAQYYGGEVASITLLPIGGVSLLKNMPDDPKKEFWVTIVGPVSNVIIGILLIPFLYLVPNQVDGAYGAFTNADVLTGISLQGFVSYMLLINFLLAVFNLLPAFPLDGGRVLRSLLAQRMSYVSATRAAVTTGQVFAFIFGIAGLLQGAWLWVIIAVFIYMGAEQEGAAAEMKTVLSRLTVGQAVEEDTKTVAPDQTLSDVVAIVLHAYQEDFPVVDGGRIVGVLTRAKLLGGLHQLGAHTTVEQVMEKEFPVVDAEARFSEVYEKMNSSGIKAIPVVKNKRLLGMVTLEHLSEVFMLLSSTDDTLMPQA
ncbi:MAG: site-2 protease family protein [Actinobacteria bacterium]|nr:site-2 protease family protein [Actinomycetota bacterium]MCL5882740.1 site-2 protease family protein [Actinomycetota bacterium]